MQFAVQDNHRPACRSCGQYPLIHEATSFAALEAEVKAEMGERPSRWRPAARAAYDRAQEHIDSAAAKLREATHRA